MEGLGAGNGSTIEEVRPLALIDGRQQNLKAFGNIVVVPVFARPVDLVFVADNGVT